MQRTDYAAALHRQIEPARVAFSKAMRRMKGEQRIAKSRVNT